MGFEVRVVFLIQRRHILINNQQYRYGSCLWNHLHRSSGRNLCSMGSTEPWQKFRCNYLCTLCWHSIVFVSLCIHFSCTCGKCRRKQRLLRRTLLAINFRHCYRSNDREPTCQSTSVASVERTSLEFIDILIFRIIFAFFALSFFHPSESLWYLVILVCTERMYIG